MLRFLIAFLVAAFTALANPISGYLVSPPHTMVAENVLIGLTEKGAVVSGRYRFRVTPDAPEHWGRPPYKLAVQLPVPVPSALKGFEDIEAEVHPFMSIRGEKYTPVPEVFYYEVPALPKEVKLAVFYFHVDRADLEKEFELLIQYDQPVISVGGKEMVYYVPFLPTFEQYRKQMDLRRESYLVTFESFGDTVIRLADPVEKLERSEPHLIAVRPRHREVIAVEKRKPNQSPQRNAGSRPSSMSSSVPETPSSLGPRG